MDVSDKLLVTNINWDPAYLQDIFQQDFYEFKDLWSADVQDSQLVSEVDTMEKYCPITEDISIDDELLCTEVKRIESE